MFFGLLGATFLSRAALLAAVNANFPSPRLLSVSVRTIIIIFVLSMVFEEVGVAEQTVLVAFGIAFGAMMLGDGNRIRHGRQGPGTAISRKEIWAFGKKDEGKRRRTVAALGFPLPTADCTASGQFLKCPRLA
jgi:hypothetical protein